MKTFTTLFLAVLILTFIFYGFRNDDPKVKNRPQSNPEHIIKFLEDLHRPYGAVLPKNIQDMILKAVSNVPDENYDGIKAINSWILKGPSGLQIASYPGSYYSGRILDIEVDNGVSTRVAAATGGLWGFTFIIPVPLSDAVNTLNISTFDSKPGDANTIFIGTGEYGINTGTGLWRTSNGGTNWTNVALSPTPTIFFRLRFDPVNSNVIHLATATGYYKSTNGGTNFTRHLSGITTDIAVNPSDNAIMYTSVWGDGIYKSTTSGVSWGKLTAGGVPTTNVGRVSISIAASSPNIICFNAATNDNGKTLGIFKTTDNGSTFTNVRSDNFMGQGFGGYANTIGVCPANPNIIIAGGVSLLRSSNGGTTWNDYSNPTDPLYDPNNLHDDQHSVTWNASGTYVWVGNDGGMSVSFNAGLSWSTAGNTLPITQYVLFDVGGGGSHIIGGSQDNGISGTTDGGSSWWFWKKGDGGGVAIDWDSPNTFAVTLGAYGGNLAWRRLLTTNNGSTWTDINSGIDPSGQWLTKIRNDKVSVVWLYSNAGPYVYQTTNYGTLWTKLNTTAFPAELSNLNVAKFSGAPVVYACLGSTVHLQRLRVYDNGTWTERSQWLSPIGVQEFPAGVMVQTVAQHPTNNNKAYALMNGLGSTQKVYYTTDRGIHWTNRTGDLPNIPVTDLVPHPTDDLKLYLSSAYGCFRTTNGGTNWTRWNNGIPSATLVTEMSYIDDLSTNGKFYIVAATYGRSIWTREISGDDPPIGIHNGSTDVISFELKQNYPNPFNPSTEIKFAMPFSDFITLKVYDIRGREVRTLVNDKMNQGIHTVNFNGSDLSSGVYFYKLYTSKFTDVKKMILMK